MGAASVAGAAVAAAAALAALPGCDQASLRPVQVDEFPAAAQDALCDWAVRCRHVPDEATCRRLIDPRDYDVRRTADAVAAGRMTWDAAKAAACVEATREADCAGVPFIDCACDEMIRGRVPAGGACTSSYECDSNAICENPVCGVQCCEGTCGPPRVDPGCGALDLAREGEACESHADCEIGLYCEVDRRCTRLPDEEGEHCLFGCATGDLWCDVASETCVRFVEIGASCDGGAGRCDDAYAFCQSGVCVARPGAGEPCDLGVRLCVGDLWCDFSTGSPGVCAEPRGPGGSCYAPEQCEVACDFGIGMCVGYETCEP